MTRYVPGPAIAQASALALLALAACASPAAAQHLDSVWDPKPYGINGLAPPTPAPVGAIGATGQGATPLPKVSQCANVATIVSQGTCSVPPGTWGGGTRTTTWNNGCGLQYTTQEQCEVACLPVRTQVGPNGACEPANGSYGQGSYLRRINDGCGSVYDERPSCCRPGNVPVGGPSGCQPYNGAYWAGRTTQLFADGCGSSHYEYQSCCVPNLYEVYRTGCGASNGSYGSGIMQIAFFDGCGGGKQIEVPCNTPVPCVDFDRPDCHDSAHQ